jgi:hypothetical protein
MPMEPEAPGQNDPSTTSHDVEVSMAEDTEPADPRTLVAQMVRAGEWPEPALLEQIVAAGEAAVPPLLEILQTRPRGRHQDAAFVHAIGLLGMIRSSAALAALIEIARHNKEDACEEAGDALASYGQGGFVILLELIRDPTITGYHRASLIDCAKCAAGEDVAMRAQVAGVIREVFVEVAAQARGQREAELKLALVDLEEQLERAQQELAEAKQELAEAKQELAEAKQELAESEQEFQQFQADDPDRGEEEASTLPGTDAGDDDEPMDQDDLLVDHEDLDEEDEYEFDDDDEDEDECLDHHPIDALSYLAYDLCDLTDSLARDMIKTAFEEGLIKPSILDLEDVEHIFECGGMSLGYEGTWLDGYKESYAEEIRTREELKSIQPIHFPSRTSHPSFEPMLPEPAPPRAQPIAPIRNTAPKIGRNDPCWCGSGKKYKKCHLGKDVPA